MPLPAPPSSDAILDQLVDAVCVVDGHGRFLYSNPACEALLGYSRAELHGTCMIELVHPDDRGRTLQTVGRVMAGEPATRFHNRYLRKDGGVVSIEWSSRWSDAHQARFAIGRAILVRG